MGKLFGTDGIRGVANQYPMTVDVAMATGRAVADFIRQQGKKSAIIGRDTRLSGTMLEAALAAGITAEGLDVSLAGVIPTPGVAFLVSRTSGAGAGIVISASHNPYQDNGIKLFTGDGHKLSDEQEDAVEARVLALISGMDGMDDSQASDLSHGGLKTPPEPGRIYTMSHARKGYVAFLKQCITLNNTHKPSLTPLVVDCSNGAASGVAEEVFKALGLDARFIHHTPDGRNINEACGSQHTEDLAVAVKKHNARAGLAFDGDADRLIALDENGVPLTGDVILAICARHAAAQKQLPHNRVVSTVMSNIGLGLALADLGIDHEITGVGDRQVMAAMQRSGATMGGEDSGHVIFSNFHTTGDGILTALRLLSVMAETGKPLSALAKVMKVYPQVLQNVPVSPDRPDFMAIAPIARAINAAEKTLIGQGRILVRYSGTQPLLRVMVEGPDPQQTQGICSNVCEVIADCMGV
ncbi:phosphoglucosamine mutase [Desulfocicer niacini]